MVVKKSGFPDQFFRFMNLFHQGCRQAIEYVGYGFGHLGAKKEKTAAVLGLGSGGIRCSPPRDSDNAGGKAGWWRLRFRLGKNAGRLAGVFAFWEIANQT